MLTSLPPQPYQLWTKRQVSCYMHPLGGLGCYYTRTTLYFIKSNTEVFVQCTSWSQVFRGPLICGLERKRSEIKQLPSTTQFGEVGINPRFSGFTLCNSVTRCTCCRFPYTHLKANRQPAGINAALSHIPDQTFWSLRKCLRVPNTKWEREWAKG